MILIKRAGTINSLKHLDEVKPWFKLVVSGLTKEGNQLSGSKFAIPLVGTTAGLNLQPGKWVKRLGSILDEEGSKAGWLFTRKLNPPRLFEFEGDFSRVLEKVQATTDFVTDDADLGELYGMLRSSRSRGITTHARNMGVSEQLLLHIFNCWRKEMHAIGGVANLDMADTYSKLDMLASMLFNVSRPL
eukprot:scaffold74372_cov57-Attheya_sp.AAC.1